MALGLDKALGKGPSVDVWTLDVITIQTSDAAELNVDKGLLMSSSKFWSDMLSTCDTGRIALDETKESIEGVLEVLNDTPHPTLFHVTDKSCWEVYKKVLVVADKYDMPVVRERVEKWLVSRCLRGKTRCSDFKFQDIRVGQEWLGLCAKYGLRCLGWFVAYDLGSQLAKSGWEIPVSEFLLGINDTELLKTMLEAVQDEKGKRPQEESA